jgi:transposase
MPSEPITSRRETTGEKRAEVWTWYKAGKTYSEIGRRTDLTKSTVAGIIRREKRKTGQDRFSSAPRPGRPPKVTPKAERRLLRAASKDTRATLAALSTPSKSGLKLSKTTVRKVLKRNGKARRRARRKPYLSKVHKRRRVIFGKAEKRRNWRRVCWSDEATFEIGYDGRNWWVTRAPGEEYLEKNLKPSFKSGRTSVGVWGCFMDTHLGPLVILPKGARMNQRRYTEEILKPHFVPFYNKMRRKYGKEVVMQEDGAKYHFAPIPAAYKNSHKVQRLEWPPQSPDLSPIENLWKRLKDRISARRHRIRSIEEMEIALQQEWARLEEEILDGLMESMPKRIDEMLKNKGGSTKY